MLGWWLNPELSHAKHALKLFKLSPQAYCKEAMYSPMASNIVTLLCNHHHYLFPYLFHQLKQALPPKFLAITFLWLQIWLFSVLHILDSKIFVLLGLSYFIMIIFFMFWRFFKVFNTKKTSFLENCQLHKIYSLLT